MEHLLQDLRLAARALARRPWVTALAVVSLAVSIGFASVAFSVLDACLLRSLPVRSPEQLASMYITTREQRPDNLSWDEYEALARAHSFTAVATENRQGPTVHLPDRDDFPITAFVSGNYFDMLGVQAARGNVFHAGSTAGETVVISDHYWKQALGGDPAILGRPLHVGHSVLTVSGILPPGFQGSRRGLLVELFTPAEPGGTDFELLGRLRPGVTLAQAQTEVNAILRQLEKDGREPGPGRRAVVYPLVDKMIVVEAVFLAALALLLVVAAVNVANLRLVENEGRRRETGIRLALGAGRADLLRTHLAETLLAAAAGAAGGLLLALWITRLLPALIYAGQRYLDYGIRVDGRTFAFASGALLLVALVGALIPAADAWRRRALPGIQGARSTASSRWLTALVIAQMAVVTAIVCTSGLLWRSLQNVSAIRPAMDTDRKLLLASGFWQGPEGGADRTALLAERIAALPGVERVAWARRAMLSGSGGGASVTVEASGQPQQSLFYNQVSPSYFATTGARVLAGRAFRESDDANSTAVAMVNALFARRLLGGQALGQWVKVDGQPRQIVGIVEDGPSIHLKEAPAPYLYFPFAQMPDGGPTFFIASPRDPAALAAAVRGAIRASGEPFTLVDTTTLAQHMRTALTEDLVAADLTGALAALGLLLATAGLFGVTLFTVTRRAREFGVRVALGAAPPALLAQVLRESGRRIAIALPVGWGLAYAARHALASLLYGVAPDDPWSLVGASALVAAIACSAALYPALRAARTDPMAALRNE
jgi:predicted permease